MALWAALVHNACGRTPLESVDAVATRTTGGTHAFGAAGGSVLATGGMGEPTPTDCPTFVPVEASRCTGVQSCLYRTQVKWCCSESTSATCQNGRWSLWITECDCPETGGTSGTSVSITGGLTSAPAGGTTGGSPVDRPGGSAGLVGRAAASTSSGGVAGAAGRADISAGASQSGRAGTAGSAVVQPIVTSSSRAYPLGCPTDPSLPECGPNADPNATAIRDFDCVEASMKSHGCVPFNWPLGTEWLMVCDPYNHCDWPVVIDRIVEDMDQLSLEVTVTQTCSVCDGKSRHCQAALVDYSTKPVRATWKTKPANCGAAGHAGSML